MVEIAVQKIQLGWGKGRLTKEFICKTNEHRQRPWGWGNGVEGSNVWGHL